MIEITIDLNFRQDILLSVLAFGALAAFIFERIGAVTFLEMWGLAFFATLWKFVIARRAFYGILDEHLKATGRRHDLDPRKK